MPEAQTITSSLLHSFGACANQVEIFDARFPHGLDLNRPDSELIPLLDGLDLDWAASHLLTAPAWAAYRAAIARALLRQLRLPAGETP